IQVRDQVAWGDIATQVQNLLDDAEHKLTEQSRAQQAELNAQYAQRLRQEQQVEQTRRRAQVEALLLQSQHAFESRNFRFAKELALKAQEIDPSSVIAGDLVHAATKADRDRSAEEYYQAKAREIRQLLEAQEELKTPYTKVLSLDQETWDHAQR